MLARRASLDRAWGEGKVGSLEKGFHIRRRMSNRSIILAR